MYSVLMDDEEEAAKVFWGTCHGRSHEFQSQFDGIDLVEALNSQTILVTMNKRMYRLRNDIIYFKKVLD